MRHIICILCILPLFLTACAFSTETSAYEPEPSDISLEEWANRYPQQYDDWQNSVHGVAYLEGNQDAPGCTDCHRDPESGETKTLEFHLEIPYRCARCHSDETLMSQYEISSDVYRTYLADYHGTTIAYYLATDPNARRYEAVCSDCHGSHAIYAPDDPHSSIAPANLLMTCQQCHHDAVENFTAATGHYRATRDLATREDAPLVFWVKLIYQAMVPITLGLMVGYIGLDVTYRIRHKPTKEKS
ncbi:MAG: hypothetical protein KDE31_13745 [Caldilineaceae bacterium]|nr:hypothetical protein [Caldilineaceae bacterium]